MIYWFTGQPGSGKTTLANALALELGTIVVDGDVLRRAHPTGFDMRSRHENVLRAQITAEYLNEALGNVCVAVIAPYKEQRDMFKDRMDGDLIEIYCHTSEIRGKESFFAEDYEPPEERFIDMDTTTRSVEDCLGLL